MDTPRASRELQESLDRLCGWAAEWDMAFNVQKCHVMHVGRNNPRATNTMNGIQLQTTDSERDVGVVISQDLRQVNQCKKAAQTASTVLGKIHRAFHIRDRHVYTSSTCDLISSLLLLLGPLGTGETLSAWRESKKEQ
jgi:ribonucleases P/MRP protein subunit RPP40